jgi:hypothetical protein
MNTILTRLAVDSIRHALALNTGPGIPRLPHIPNNLLTDILFPKQREENLLFLSLWVIERDSHNLEMSTWHADAKTGYTGVVTLQNCGEVHCISGFAQVMCGEKGFFMYPGFVGRLLLGDEAGTHFTDSNADALCFLRRVISRNSPGASA